MNADRDHVLYLDCIIKTISSCGVRNSFLMLTKTVFWWLVFLFLLILFLQSGTHMIWLSNRTVTVHAVWPQGLELHVITLLSVTFPVLLFTNRIFSVDVYLSLAPWKGLWRLAGSWCHSAEVLLHPPQSRRWDSQTRWQAAPEPNAGLKQGESSQATNLKPGWKWFSFCCGKKIQLFWCFTGKIINEVFENFATWNWLKVSIKQQLTAFNWQRGDLQSQDPARRSHRRR